jgi:hypothetical protein
MKIGGFKAAGASGSIHPTREKTGTPATFGQPESPEAVSSYYTLCLAAVIGNPVKGSWCGDVSPESNAITLS